MEYTRRRFTDALRVGIGISQFSESEKTNVEPTGIMSAKFSPSGLIVTGTVQTSPEWYESLQKTVDFIVEQRLQQMLPVLHQIISDIVDEKIIHHQLSEIPVIESPQQDLTKEQIKSLILQEIAIGQVFYPSDIADKFGLDLVVVMDVISELEKEGKLKNTGNVNANLS